MGRIETPGMTLVDLKETMKLIGQSRRTVFRLRRRGYLVDIDVAGDRKTYFTLESISRVQERYKTCERLKDRSSVHQAVSIMDLISTEPPEQKKKRRLTLMHHHPGVFPTQYR